MTQPDHLNLLFQIGFLLTMAQKSRERHCEFNKFSDNTARYAARDERQLVNGRSW